jgi:hypothetical protein
MNNSCVSIPELRKALLGHQRKLRSGDNLPSFTELAAMAGVHRDTLYALMAGDRVNERSQYAISKALTEVRESKWNQPSRLLSIDLDSDGPRLKFGFVDKNIFSRH